MALGQPAEALEELNVLKDLAPEEANVWFLMGRLYKMVGERGRAVKAFTIALNLDPKVSLDPERLMFNDSDFCYRPHNLSRTLWKVSMMMKTLELTTTRTWTDVEFWMSVSHVQWLPKAFGFLQNTV